MTTSSAPNISDLLKELVARNGSSLHLTLGVPPRVRVDGTWVAIDQPALTVDHIRRLVATVLPPPKVQQLEDPQSAFVTSMFGVKGLARFQLTAYVQRGAPAVVIKRIPFELPETPSWLSPAFDGLKPDGLVIVAGAAGSGRSTTLAMLVRQLNQTQAWRVLTLEDPIAYTFANERCVIEQVDLESPMPVEFAVQVARTTQPDAVVVAMDDDLRTASEIVGAGSLVIASVTVNSAEAATALVKKALPAQQETRVIWLSRPGEGSLLGR